MKPARAREASQLIVNKYVTELSGLPVGLLTRFLEEVLAWTGEIALVSRRRPEQVCERLLLESIELMTVADLSTGDRVADIGSGAGFPGIVWAAVHPDVRVALIERRERKAVFLERLAHVLDLRNVDVVAGDVTSAAAQWPRLFSLAVAMAVGNTAALMSDARSLMSVSGRFVCTAPAAEAVQPGSGGFTLESRTQGRFGSYAIYRFGV